MKRGNAIILLYILLFIGFTLRIYRLGNYGFWYDEICSICRANYSNLIFPSEPYTNPPLFFILLRICLYLSTDEFILRLLPVIFGILSIITIYLLSRLIFDTNTALISSLLLSVSPFSIYYSRELLPYSLFLFLSLTSVYLFLLAIERKEVVFWILFIIFTLFCLLSHYSGIFLLVVENIYFFIFYRSSKVMLKKWLLSQIIIIVLFSLFFTKMLVSIYKFVDTDLFNWVPKGNWFDFGQLFKTFNLGYNATGRAYGLSFFIFTFIFLAGVYKEKGNKIVYLLVIWLFVPIILASVVSKFLVPIFVSKIFIFLLPPYLIILALGINKIKKLIYKLIMITAIIILSFSSLNNYFQNKFFYSEIPFRAGIHEKVDNKFVAEYIRKRYSDGDLIFHTSPSTYLPMTYYFCSFFKPNVKIKCLSSDWDEQFFTFCPINLKKSGEGVSINLLESTKMYRRIWLIFSYWEPSEPPPSINSAKQYFDENCILIDYKEFIGIKLYLYLSKNI